MAETAAQAAQAAPTDAPLAEKSVLDRIIDEGGLAADPGARAGSRDMVREFVERVLENTKTIRPDTETMINEQIAHIDGLLSDQLNEIMHHPEMQKLEASWRGLRYLLDHTETSERLKIKVFNVSKQDLLNDLTKAPEFDQSALFKKVYEEEFGSYGGAPFGALLGDYDFGRSNQDVLLLEKISQVAAAAHAPFMAAASSQMFGLDSFTKINDPRDMAKVFDSTEYVKWKSFRDSEDSRYVTLTLPRILIREPYGSESVPVEAFNFEEKVDGKDHNKYLWANAAWSLGARVTDAFARHGWCAMIRGPEGGGRVEGLPVHNFKTDAGEKVMKCPTEMPIPNRRDNELKGLGFAALVHERGTDKAAFFNVPTAQKPKVYNLPDATANASLSAGLPYIFAVSRFAHYLKAILQDKIGSPTTRSELQAFLNTWIADYVVGNDDAPMHVKAERPLKEADIEVTEIPGKPGAYSAIARLRPHFQLEEVTISLRLVARSPSGGG